MKSYKNHTLQEYAEVLSLKTPTPGGGSAAALTAALGAALLSMVANYSLGKGSPSNDQKIKKSLKQSEQLRKRFLALVDLDAKAYLKVVQTRKGPPQQRKAALRKAREVPMEVCKLCYKAVQLSPTLVRYGNKYLISDVKVALELLLAAFNSARTNVEVNQ